MSASQRLTAVFRETFELDEGVDVTSLRYRELPQWDSVGHMRLVAGIEDAFGIMLETFDVLDMSSYAKSVEILGKYNVDATN